MCIPHVYLLKATATASGRFTVEVVRARPFMEVDCRCASVCLRVGRTLRACPRYQRGCGAPHTPRPASSEHSEECAFQNGRVIRSLAGDSDGALAGDVGGGVSANPGGTRRRGSPRPSSRAASILVTISFRRVGRAGICALWLAVSCHPWRWRQFSTILGSFLPPMEVEAVFYHIRQFLATHGGGGSFLPY